MTDLAEWLLAAIADDEQNARNAGGKTWHVTDDAMDDGERIEGDDITIYAEGGHNAYQAEHIARWDPASVLAECDAKRRILAEHRAYDWPGTQSRYCMGCGLDSDEEPRTDDVNDCPVLLALALPYASHDGYQAEWAP